MNYAWEGSLGQAKAMVKDQTLIPAVDEGFRHSYGNPPAEPEKRAWQESLPGTIRALSGDLSDDIRVVVEYRLPFNGQRADLVLLGRMSRKPAAHVVELKHWASSQVHPDLEHFVVSGRRPLPHPSYQAANYAGKLKYFHSVAQNWEVDGSALVSDSSAQLHAGLKDGKYAELWKAAPVFLPGEAVHFLRYVQNRISEPPDEGDVARFLSGTYSQSLRLLDAIEQHQEAIRERAFASLAVSGWGMSDDQLDVYDQIVATVRRGEPATYLLSGGPGSGKTLLAVSLLLGLAGMKKSVVLAVRNNRLNAALKAVVDFAPFGATGVMKYFSTLPRGRHGVEDGDSEIADVLICDEGQRLALGTENVFRRTPVTVVLFDEEQILNTEESGTETKLHAAAARTGKEVRFLSLPTLHRCRGGQKYVEWVDALLRTPSKAGLPLEDWGKDYSFTVAESHQDLVTHLKGFAEEKRRVALLAAFTRSSGRTQPVNSNDLGIIRVPEVTPPIRWLMNPQTEYVPFWVQGESNRLTHCASIYGSQGFETDIAGVIWGDDFVVRDGEWRVGNPSNCYDVAPGATHLSTLMRDKPAVALPLLRNRYRIFLTRGIFGTCIFCEDPETQKFLRGL